VLVLLRHRVHIITHVVDTLAERVCALTQDLNSLLHEFYIGFREATTWIGRLHSLQTLDLLGVLLLALVLLPLALLSLLLLANAAHLDLGTSVFLWLLLSRWHIIVISHQLPCLLVESSVSFTLLVLELLLWLMHLLLIVIVVVLSSVLHRVRVSFAHDVSLSALLLFLLLPGTGGFFLRLHGSLLLLLLTHDSFLLFLLLAASLVLLTLLLLGFFLLPLLLSLSFQLPLAFLLLELSLALGVLSTVVTRRTLLLLLSFLVPSNAKHLHNVRSGVDASGSGAEHLLQEVIRVFGFLACDDLRRLTIELVTHHQLSELE